MTKCNKLLAIAALIVAFTQYGCGGGSGNISSPVTDVQGLYEGVTDKDQKLSALILDDGSFYAFYWSEGDLEPGGLLMGNVKASGGTLSSSDVIDYDLTRSKTQKVAISATYAPKDWLNGTSVYPDACDASFTFTTRYNADYERTPTLTTIAGAYTGTTQGLHTSSATEVSVETDGSIAFNSGACRAKGTIAPRTFGDVYSLTLKFDESPSCSYSSQTLTGIAVAAPDDEGIVNEGILIVARAADTSHPLLFEGKAPSSVRS
ncbi:MULTISPECIES: hypothetical protein [Burkholderiaceae]|uniref:hypothetical protein n=1 Tax=Burkholderiaceae TaxID=119060 RepID=UPI00095FFA67|nr:MULTISPECIES: hypothetical protein [Burkholderiaceae]MCF2133692.1 hypothetical protein [Mycetohabitans sp. B3]MCG1039247.1 hypothetical protein [Mycetohabitans sp. B7]SIT68033.1 hypothetical protein SAMN04487769_1235 [Burkholderia sp. b14]